MPPLGSPVIDPTSILEHFRGSYGTELLTAAVAYFDLFGRLAKQPRTLTELQADLNLAERPAIVLTTSAMEQTQLAAHFTLALSGRAKNVAPVLAEQIPLDNATTLLDVGGGTWLLRQHGRSVEGVWVVFATGNWALGRLTLCSPFDQTGSQVVGNGCKRARIRKT